MNDGRGERARAELTKPAAMQDAATISATAVIESFGGIRPMAARLGVPVTTVQGWKERDRIPARRWESVRAAAERHYIVLDVAAAPDAAAGRDIGIAPCEPERDVDQPSPGPAGSVPPSGSAVYTQPSITASADAADALPPPPVRRATRSLPWLVVPVIVLAGAATWSTWSPWLERIAERDPVAPVQPAGEEAAAAAAGALAILTSRVGELEALVEAREPGAAVAELAAEGDILAEELGGVMQRVAELEADFETVQLTTTAPRSEAADSTLTVDLAAVEERIAALTADNARLMDLIDGLSRRLDGLEAAPTVNATRPNATGQALVLAAGQLREALARAKPYGAELRTLRLLAPNDAGITASLAVLDVYADRGIPDRDTLKARFDDIAREVVRAEFESEGSWIGKLLARLSNVISVRRTGESVTGSGAEAVVANAEARLARGDLAGAVAAFDELSGPPAVAATGWLADARARLAAERALAAIDAHAIAELGRTEQADALETGAAEPDSDSADQ